MISRQKILLYAIVFAVVWSIVISTFYSTIEGFSTLAQFVLVSVVGYLLPSVILGVSLSDKPIKRILGAFCFGAGADLILPPLMIGFNGVAVGSGMFSKASIDIFIASLWSFIVPQNLLFWFVYPISFVILMALAVYLLADKHLYSLMKGDLFGKAG